MTQDERQDAWVALRMVGDAIEELFGPVASLESEEGTLHRGPEYHHRAEGIVEALQRIKKELNLVQEQVVWGFYEERVPTFHQGQEGWHELCSPVTAKEVAAYVATIEAVRGEPTEVMVNACFGSLERYFATLPPDHEYRKKGWVNGSKAGARVKHAVRFKAMIAVALGESR